MALRKDMCRSEKGVALLLVLSVISLLTVIILEFSRNMSFTLEEAWSYKEREQLLTVAESGIDLALASLLVDEGSNDFDSVHDSWSLLAETPIKLFGNGMELMVTVTDLSGRFQLNSLVNSGNAGTGQSGGDSSLSVEQARELFLRLLQSGNFILEDELQAREITDAIVDWLDSDDQESTYGAEDDYYGSLDPPYAPRNGLIRLPHELLAVKGITSELLYGDDEKKGLADYITAYGDSGTVNINTAPPELIQSFDDRIDDEGAQLLIDFRGDDNNAEKLQDSNWYLDVSGWPKDVVLPGGLVTTGSEFFKIRAEASHNETTLSMVAYVKRAGNQTIELLYRKIL